MIDTLLSRWELGTVHRVQAVAGRLGFTLRELVVLAELLLRPGGLTNGQVQGIVGLPSATTAELLAALERRGLVERIPDLFDARCVASFATDLAGERLERRPEPARALASLVDGLDERQVAGVVQFLNRVVDRAYRDSRRIREGRVF